MPGLQPFPRLETRSGGGGAFSGRAVQRAWSTAEHHFRSLQAGRRLGTGARIAALMREAPGAHGHGLPAPERVPSGERLETAPRPRPPCAAAF
eukprot:CAMPEP_0175247602 /NCGR_PEP_ID=MMETSP0093-20121207/33706_1 /TAXON_ID=311494 /ORGANISM="Alexandrium monilatum, Strain CCMP3105" /LENGTH=92 /DNA_ID=CAMNT_0016541789 /DNA_START=33 /DNA_END=308 /DNA_ORIENTATION=-